ncbi:aspartate 1-decarboxylase [Petrocella sp. FN5]|uniref:aspartate 1-decarboxylase n=1 Tax=Petrocella sp. FN5 TaxID=3032002 RepID=UPI0023DBB3AB|nr:aspartate 1-decarboxylase [Petrocella sp. FN5]MDF1618510.1 aspartate 1-decarboxylase [Petrocella sp. FN5]
MLITMLKSKIHKATVTEANLHYEGSVTIDQALLEASGILIGEKVQIVNVNNGARFETYTIAGAPHSGIVCLNGPAARMVQPGDLVIIITYALMQPIEARQYNPTIVQLDPHNRIVNTKYREAHGHRD